MFTEPVDGHLNGHIARDSVDSFKYPIRVESRQPHRTTHSCSAGRVSPRRPAYQITASPTRVALLRVTGRTADGTIYSSARIRRSMPWRPFHPEAGRHQRDAPSSK